MDFCINTSRREFFKCCHFTLSNSYIKVLSSETGVREKGKKKKGRERKREVKGCRMRGERERGKEG